MRKGGEGYQGTAVGNWGVVGCVCTDDRRGLDEVGVS